MAKEQAVRVNLSTKANDILATMQEELPKAYYFFRKNFGGKQKYLKHEDQMLDKALEEKNDQFTDIDYWISKVGNRWMTYTQAEYFPKAQYANAFHFAFIYYETMASCGAFFPMYDPKKTKGGKTKKEGKPDGIILYTDHFFYQMSERTKIEYRSKELIKKFVSTRLENAMTIDKDGEVIVKFKGGYGFGKEYSKNPKFVAIRTFLRDEELNNKQRKACEPVDTMYELVRDGAYLQEVALNTVINSLDDPEKAAAEGMKKLEAMKKMGLEKHATIMIAIHAGFIRMLDETLHRETSLKEGAVILSIENQCRIDKLVNKYVDFDGSEEQEQQFNLDLIDFYCKVAKQMGLKYVDREKITAFVNKQLEIQSDDSLKETK